MASRIYLAKVVHNCEPIRYPIIAESREEAGVKLERYLTTTFPDVKWLNHGPERFRELTSAQNVPLDSRIEFLEEIFRVVIR